MIRGILVAVAVPLLVAGCSSKHSESIRISQGDLGDRWPLFVGGGELACSDTDYGQVATFTAGGTTYSINAEIRPGSGYRSINDIVHYGMDVQPLYQRALELCD